MILQEYRNFMKDIISSSKSVKSAATNIFSKKCVGQSIVHHHCKVSMHPDLVQCICCTCCAEACVKILKNHAHWKHLNPFVCVQVARRSGRLAWTMN